MRENLSDSGQYNEITDLFNRAHELNNQGYFEEAIAVYKMVLEKEPDDADAWLGTSYAYYQLEKYEEALAACEKELALKPYDSLAWTHKGHILNAIGRNEEAQKAYATSVQVLQENANHTVNVPVQGYDQSSANGNSENRADILHACRKECFTKKSSCQEQCVKSERDSSKQLDCLNTCRDEERACNQRCDAG